MRKEWFKVLFRRRITVALMIILQLAFFLFVLLSGSEYSKITDAVFNLVSIFVSLYIIKNKSKNAYKITWIFLIMIFPVFGGMFYLWIKLQSSTRRFRNAYAFIEKKSMQFYCLPGEAKEELKQEAPQFERHVKYLQDFNKFPVYNHTTAEYFSLGENMFEALVEELKKAEKYIFLEYFIIEEGKMWNTILDVLEEKAKSGVDVRLIYDDLGCFLLLPKDYADILRRKGIKCRIFNPFRPFIEALQNNRDHRKIAVIDGKVAFTGGINLADEYINEFEKYGHWKDTAVMLKGNAAWSFTMMFLQLWSLCTGKTENYEEFYNEKQLPEENDGFVQPYCDSPVDEENVAENVYLNIINSAKEYLYINTPYLILDENISTALILAAKSGVDVRIVTPGIWDKRIVHMATRSYYYELMEGGVKIYEYAKGFMHSKVFVSDDTVATVGTVNLDYRSLFLHFECGVCLYNSSVIEKIKEDYLATLEACHKIEAEECKGNVLTQLGGEVLRLFAPLM